jgi:small conductance mechanosensitive channel
MDGAIINLSRVEWRRIDMVFSIGYDDDLRQAKRILRELVEEHPLVAEDPPPVVAVMELGDNSVNFAVRPFTHPDDFLAVQFDITEQVKLRFDAEGISIPFPQRDIHLYQN